MQTYSGASDASAAVALDKDRFIVADDENNVLRIYSTTEGGAPLQSFDLSSFLKVDQNHPEADIEGAARIGHRIYWIGSHGRNRDGKERPNRSCFFATEIHRTEETVDLVPVGYVCRTLVHTLVDSVDETLGLKKALYPAGWEQTKKKRKALAPKEEGINIEGLCASADGRTLYIGFRNPRPKHKTNGSVCALVVPLLNAAAVIEQQAPPEFGKPVLWDFKGLGIRGMDYSEYHKTFFIIAGPHNEDSQYILFRWSVQTDTWPDVVCPLVVPAKDFTPEGIVAFEGRSALWLLSDDGSLWVRPEYRTDCLPGNLRPDGHCQNKYLINPAHKHFRGVFIDPSGQID
jgi:hypothetical protein